MIYLDNAATTLPKPPAVINSIREAIYKTGNPGRGAHPAAIWSALKINETREKLAELFGIRDHLRIAFTQNCTHGLNIAVNLCKGEILTTSMDHNSVLRPCNSRGGYRVFYGDQTGDIISEQLIDFIKPQTTGVIMSHASNVTGQIYEIDKIGSFCKKKNILFILDAAQSAGIADIDVDKMNIDILCFSGHKGLFGLQGTGGIYISPKVNIKPFMYGGTGSKSFDLRQPLEMPDCYETGTMNVHGIAALSAGIDYIRSVGIENIRKKEEDLRKYFIHKGKKEIKDIVFYGNDKESTGVISFNIGTEDPFKIATYLGSKDICARAGYHCAPLAHKTLGTEQTGTVRFGFSHLNTFNEIDIVIDVLKNMKRLP